MTDSQDLKNNFPKNQPNFSPTIGSNVEEIVCKNVHFFMWDIGGQDSLRNSWNTYFADSDFVIFVVDSTDRERLPISKMEVRFVAKVSRNR